MDRSNEASKFINCHVRSIFILFFLMSVMGYSYWLNLMNPGDFFRSHVMTQSSPKDELEISLSGASMGNNTVIVSILNRAYAVEDGMLDLFLRTFQRGKDTGFLLDHLLLVAVDQKSYDRCNLLHNNCYKLVTDGVDFSKEMIYLSAGYLQMMWRRTSFIIEILKRNYNILFTSNFPKDDLARALEGASMGNKTLIISILNRAYATKNGMLDLFLEGFHVGQNTSSLVNHLLLVTVDQTSYDRCNLLHRHCYKLVTESVDFSKEVLFMSEDFIRMMWRRTLFLGEILKRGYNFVFSDMDVLWLRDPFKMLSHEDDDIQISCDKYLGNSYDESNPLNTGFYHVVSNNKTIALFDEWYDARNRSVGKKEQDVLADMKNSGVFRSLKLKVRFLDVFYFAGFCENSGNFSHVRTLHANCCRSIKAKLGDLTLAIDEWKRYVNGTLVKFTWPQRKACEKSWKENLQ